MSKSSPSGAEWPPADLLESQILANTVSDSIRGDSPYTTLDILVPTANPAEIRARLGTTSLADMLIAPGEALRPNPRQEPARPYPIVHPGIDADLVGVSVGTWGTYTEKTRIVPPDLAAAFEQRNDAFTLPVEGGLLVRFPDEFDWTGNVHLTLWHQRQGERKVGERLMVSTSHGLAGQLPKIESLVAIPGEQPEDGHTAYGRLERTATDDAEAVAFLEIVRSLHELTQSE